MNHIPSSPVLERQLLLQLGDRIKQLRKSQGIGTVDMAQRAGIARSTLSAIEAGDPGPSMGNYVRVMSALGVAGDLAMLVSDTFQPAPAGSAAARSQRAKPTVQVVVSSDSNSHQAQDLQSLALHELAVEMVRREPELLGKAAETLKRWMERSPTSRSMVLWREWEKVLQAQTWRRVLGRTQRAQQLRQASPLVTVLSDDARLAVLKQVRDLKAGIELSSEMHLEGAEDGAQ